MKTVYVKGFKNHGLAHAFMAGMQHVNDSDLDEYDISEEADGSWTLSYEDSSYPEIDDEDGDGDEDNIFTYDEGDAP